MNNYLSNALIYTIYDNFRAIDNNNIMRSDTNNNEIFLDWDDDMYGYIKNISDQTNEIYDLYHIAENAFLSRKAYMIRNIPIKDNDMELYFNGQITDAQVREILSKCDGFSDRFNGNINIYRGSITPDIFVTNDHDTVRIQYIKDYYDAHYRVDFYKNSAIWYKNDKHNFEWSHDVYDIDGQIIYKSYYENHRNEFK